MKLYKKCAVNPYYFLVIDTTLESDSSLRFEKNPLEKNEKAIIAIDGKIRNEKLQNDINRNYRYYISIKYQHYRQLINMKM